MADQLELTLSTGEKVAMEVEDGRAALKSLASGHTPFGQAWIQADDDTLVRADAVVAARLVGDPHVYAL